MFYLDNKIGRFLWQTNVADFCTTDDRFLLADFIRPLYRSSDISFSHDAATGAHIMAEGIRWLNVYFIACKMES